MNETAVEASGFIESAFTCSQLSSEGGSARMLVAFDVCAVCARAAITNADFGIDDLAQTMSASEICVLRFSDPTAAAPDDNVDDHDSGSSSCPCPPLYGCVCGVSIVSVMFGVG